MAKTVLVVDANPAVQAVSSLALTQSGLNVRTVERGENALRKALSLKPDIIVCANEMPGIDPLSFCRHVKKNSELAQTGFILLAPRSSSKSVIEEAKNAGVDHVLLKPFKSDQLRDAVENILNSVVSGQDNQIPKALIIASDPLLQKIFSKTFKKRNIRSVYIDSENEAAIATKRSSFVATVIQSEAQSELDWFDKNKMGELLIIGNKQNLKIEAKKQQFIQFLDRPLSEKQIEKVLSNFLPESTNSRLIRWSPLGERTLTELAARISGAIFHRLLTLSALREGKWDEACQEAKIEALKICEQFEQEGFKI